MITPVGKLEGEKLVRGRWRGKGPLLDVRVARGRVMAVGPASCATPDLGGDGAVLLPPLLDIQVNGANGVDLQDPGLDAAGLHAITRFLAGRGVGHWVPTIITNSPEAMEHAIRLIAVAAAADRVLARAMVGIHLEGPFISPLDGPRGAHPLAHVRPPDWPLMQRLLRAGDGLVRYVTLAPETSGAVGLMQKLVAQGVRVSLGHHAATAAQVRAAADAGATLCTHLGNGVATQLQRHLNPLWPQMDEPRLTASLIADGHHLPPEVLRVIVRAKSAGNTILVSDCTHLTGLKPGRYDSFGQQVELGKDGAIRIPGTQLLAGSASTLDACVEKAVAMGAMPWPEAIDAATRVPGKALGISVRTALPRVGGPAAISVITS